MKLSRAEQAAIDYVADQISGESATQKAHSQEVAEFHFDGNLSCAIEADAQAVARSIKSERGDG